MCKVDWPASCCVIQEQLSSLKFEFALPISNTMAHQKFAPHLLCLLLMVLWLSSSKHFVNRPFSYFPAEPSCEQHLGAASKLAFAQSFAGSCRHSQPSLKLSEQQVLPQAAFLTCILMQETKPL